MAVSRLFALAATGLLALHTIWLLSHAHLRDLPRNFAGFFVVLFVLGACTTPFLLVCLTRSHAWACAVGLLGALFLAASIAAVQSATVTSTGFRIHNAASLVIIAAIWFFLVCGLCCLVLIAERIGTP